ncbi:MAG: hypothetical protein QJR03_10805 [Sphaerobacter sp.]|nr:hypothetical protein [Sphaerobacter sp.]
MAASITHFHATIGARVTVAHLAGTDARTSWSFVYGFFSNGTPFDAPNRSEPCCFLSSMLTAR